jgi:hypothetical protein
MEVKTTKIRGKRYLLKRIDNGAWEFILELSDELWNQYCSDNLIKNKMRAELRDLKRKGPYLTVAGEARLVEVTQILSQWED